VAEAMDEAARLTGVPATGDAASAPQPAGDWNG
jgi:hypothetical protein